MSEMCRVFISKEASKDNIMDEDDENTPYGTPIISPCSSFSSYETCFSYLDDISFDIDSYSGDQLVNQITEELSTGTCTDYTVPQSEIGIPKDEIPLQSSTEISEDFHISTGEVDELKITAEDHENKITGEDEENEITGEDANKISEDRTDSLLEDNDNIVSKDEKIDVILEEIEISKEETGTGSLEEKIGTEPKNDNIETSLDEIEKFQYNDKVAVSETHTGPSLEIVGTGTENDEKIQVLETKISESVLSETGTIPSVVEDIGTSPSIEEDVGTQNEKKIRDSETKISESGLSETGTSLYVVTDTGTENGENIGVLETKISENELYETSTIPSVVEDIGTGPSIQEDDGTKIEEKIRVLETTNSESVLRETVTSPSVVDDIGTENELSHSIVTKNDEKIESVGTEELDTTGTEQPHEYLRTETITKPLKPLVPYDQPVISTYRTDPATWTPPLPAASQPEKDEIFSENSESSDSDDNIPIDGIKLTKSTDFNEIEQRERAMLDTMNGEFKELVRMFMEAEGFTVPPGEDDDSESDSWRRIVRVLSWQSGLLIKPDAGSGKEMDPAMYVKVKCVPSGHRSQSEVVNGLVFKKSAAHKHMPTLIRNPRLLLLKGVLSHSVAGISSIHSMEKEKDVLEKEIRTMMEALRPEIILVEKTVPREVQEILLKQSITVILDMKPQRMNRIVRCTGSAVVTLEEALKRRPADVITTCEKFRIERFDNSSKQSKSLLFLEGLPKPLGCTILLRGGNVEELKKIKRILNYTIFAAYHLILVTSFFADQKLFANYKIALREENSIVAPKPLSLISESSIASSTSTLTQELDDAELPSYPSNNNNHKFDVLSRVNSASPNLGFVQNEKKGERNNGSERMRVREKNPNLERENSSDPRSILIIESSRNIGKHRICESSHISRITYYSTSDKTLGTYLQDILLNEKHRCAICGEPPESHAYVFTHKNGRLTVLVSSIPPKLELSSSVKEKENSKIWMWTSCLGCKRETGIAGPKERFVISDAARNLSFGKFLELSFLSRLSEKQMGCGHLLHRDGLRFFGMGTKVAMFRYSHVELYSASRPPSMLDYNNYTIQDWLQIEALDVSKRRAQLYSEVERIAKDLREKCSDDHELLEKISQDSLLSTQERTQLEVSLTSTNSPSDNATIRRMIIQDVLSLNWLYQTLFLETYMWDQRLDHLQILANCKRAPPNSANPQKAQNPNTDISEDTNLEIIRVPELEKPDQESESNLILDVTNSKIEEKNELMAWIWAPFNNVLISYKKELQGGYLDRFKLVNKYKPLILRISTQNPEVDSRFYVGPGGNVFSVFEDEISSLIAYALCVSEENRKDLDETNKPILDASILLSATSSISSDEFLFISKDLHPEIELNKKSGFLFLKGKYSITCVYARQFHDLRKKCCPSEIAYITSLSRCKKWNAQGGKSKVFFAKTMDERFIIKQVKRTEFDSFLQFAPDYFKHMSESGDRRNPTVLAKILGIYQVCEVRNGKETRMDLVVMENLLFGHNVSRTYDLKGAMFARHVADSDSSEDQGKVFLDQNFIEDMRSSPIYLDQKTKKLLERALWNDTCFLTLINVMDYSLLVGVDRENKRLVFGIIDYMRQYTWDKQLETWVKSSLVVPKNELPTVISPKEYKKRFRKFMQTQILSVPEGWGDEN